MEIADRTIRGSEVMPGRLGALRAMAAGNAMDLALDPVTDATA
jgi:hypothetical protein